MTTPAFEAAKHNSLTNQLEVQSVGQGTPTTIHAAAIYAADKDGTLQRFPADAPVWQGARVVLDAGAGSDVVSAWADDDIGDLLADLPYLAADGFTDDTGSTPLGYAPTWDLANHSNLEGCYFFELDYQGGDVNILMLGGAPFLYVVNDVLKLDCGESIIDAPLTIGPHKIGLAWGGDAMSLNVNNEWMRYFLQTQALTHELPDGMVFSRSSDATVVDYLAALFDALVNEPRFVSTRHFQSYFVNTDNPVTTLIPDIGAGDYILSATGTGSVVLSGGPSGTLTLEGNRKQILFNVVSDTVDVTFTVSGTLTNWQLERDDGSGVASEYLPTNNKISLATLSGVTVDGGGVLTQGTGAPINASILNGLTIEGPRTNLVTDYDGGISTTADVIAGDNTLSITGSGSVDVTAGSAVGSGFGTATAGNDVTINISTGGTVNLTVNGEALTMQVEAGSFSSSLIKSAGATTTRDRDEVTWTHAFAADFSFIYELTPSTDWANLATNECRVFASNDARGSDYELSTIGHASTYGASIDIGNIVFQLSQADFLEDKTCLLGIGASQVAGDVQYKIYLDGVEKASATITGTLDHSNSGQFNIGYNSDEYPFIAVKKFGVYDRLLTDDEFFNNTAQWVLDQGAQVTSGGEDVYFVK